jgi:hypothetical protein
MASSGRVRFAQIDGLKENTQEDANDGDILVFDAVNEEFKAEAPGIATEVISFRRAMLLMGG